MQKFMEDLMKNSTNPQAVFQQFVDANKAWTQTMTDKVLPAWQETASAAPQKTMETVQKYTDLNTKYAQAVQDAMKKTPFDINAIVQATVEYQKNVLKANTSYVEDVYAEVVSAVKNVTPKK